MSKSYYQIKKEVLGENSNKNSKKSRRSYNDIKAELTNGNYDFSFIRHGLERQIGFDTLETDLSSMGKTIEDAYTGWQTPETMLNAQNSVSDIQRRLGAYEEYRMKYGNGADMPNLSQLLSAYGSASTDIGKLTEQYAGYANADEYDMVTSLYRMPSNEIQTKWEESKKLDTAKKHNDEIKRLTNRLNNASTVLDTDLINDAISKETARRDEYLKSVGYNSMEELEGIVGNYVSGDVAYTTSQGQNITWKDLYDNTKYQEGHDVKYKEISSSDDFKYYTDIGKKISNPTYEEAFGGLRIAGWSPFGKDINNELKFAKDNEATMILSGSNFDPGDVYYAQATDEEYAIYNYYLGQELEGVAEKGTADAYLKSIYDTLKDRYENKWVAGMVKYADEHPVLASGVSVFQNLASGAEWIGDASRYLASGMQGEMDDNAMAKYSSTIRGTVSNKYDLIVPENDITNILGIAGWDAHDFLYNTTMSGVDSSVAMSTLGGGGGIALGLSAAAQGTNDALDRGLDNKGAFLAGLHSGMFECLFESASIGQLKSLKQDTFIDTLKTYAKNIGKTMGVNASEEFFTEVANIVYDDVANGGLSQAETQIRAYINAGMSEEDAKRKVASEKGLRIAEATASGGLMGLGFGITGGATAYYNTYSTGKGIRANERVDDVFDITSNPEIGSAYETYTEYARKGINAENAKNAQIGRLYMEARTDAQNTLDNKNATNLQKRQAIKNLARLSVVEKENTIKKKAKEEFNVGDETKVTKTGEIIDTKNIRVEDDKITVSTENGKVSVDDVTLSERDAELAYIAKEIAKEDGDKLANLFLQQYDGKTNVEAYQNSFNLTMEYAKNDYTFDEMMNHKGSLSAQQVSKIYEETRIKAAKEKEAYIQKLADAMADKNFYKGIIDDTIIDYDNTSAEGKVNWNSLDARQRQAVTFIKAFAKATGMNLVIEHNPKSKYGGMYDNDSNTITIDVSKYTNYANVVMETIIPTMSHETTHWMEEKAPELFMSLQDKVFVTLTEHYNSNTEQALKDKRELMEKLKPYHEYTDEELKDIKVTEELLISAEILEQKLKGRNYSDKEARSEIIARACEDILSMSEHGKKMFNSLSESEKKTFAGKIKEIIQNFNDWISEMLGSYKSTSKEAEILRQYQDKLQEIAKIWDEMLEKSVVANQALEKSGAFNHQASADGEVQFKMREIVEETRDLIAVHNASESQIIEAVSRGHFIMPSVAVTNKNHTAFGDFSVVFYKEAIDPETNKSNKLYGADAWTPTQTTLKINPKFDNAKTVDAVKDIKKSIGKNWSQIFDVNSAQFKKTIADAKGSLYDAYSENIGMQTAYAMKNGLISALPMNNGRVDVNALKNSLDEKLNKDEVWREYKKWLGEISNTIITEYDKASTQDILDSMKAQPNTAKVFKLSESGELTVPAAEYKSIDEMRQNKHRLSENAEESAKAVGAEFISWANNISNRIGVDAKSIVNAINSSFDSRYNINGIVKSFNENGVSITNADAKSIQELYKKAVELPTLYFEAKPDGTVGFERVAMIAVPDTASDEVKSLLDENGIHYKVYEADNVKSRLNVLNSSENVKFSDRDNGVVNTSMTMDEAKQMIQRAFVLGGIEEWYEGEYKNGDEWLRGEGVSDVALHIENEYTLAEKYLNKIPSYINGDFYVEDILEAYLNGTLVGKEKPKAKRLDISKDYRINDKRFYSPQRVKNVKNLLNVAMQRVTDKNRQEVSNARAKILLFAHNKGASELLGMTQAELNKKLRVWSGYSAKARDISKRFNNGVAESNKWTGIENCSWLYKGTVTTKDLESLVKSVKGASSEYEKMYIARTMLALDTHIDWSWLSFEFDTYNNVNKGKTFSISKCLGYYRNDGRKIVVSHDKPHTVAHEMGHALDYQWARDLGYDSTALTEVSRLTERITDADAKQFFENFRIFLDSLTDNGDIRSEYSQDPKEVFARFVARFVQWVDNTGTGRNTYNTETSYYNDKFTASHYIEFVKLLQEKAMLDARKMETANEGVKYSDRYTEQEYRDYGWARANGILNEGQNEDYRSKFADAVNGYVKFNKSKRGEFIIPVSDIYDSQMEGIDNILVFAMGNIDNPIITSIIEIYEFDETNLDITRRNIYELERRGIQQTFGDDVKRYYASDFSAYYYGEYTKGGIYDNGERFGRGNREKVEGANLNRSDIMYNDRDLDSLPSDELLRKFGNISADVASDKSLLTRYGSNSNPNRLNELKNRLIDNATKYVQYGEYIIDHIENYTPDQLWLTTYGLHRADGIARENYTREQFLNSVQPIIDELKESLGYTNNTTMSDDDVDIEGLGNVLKLFFTNTLGFEDVSLTTVEDNTNKKDPWDGILFSDRETESIYDILGERDRIEKEIEQFKAEIENLKERVELEKTVTKGKVLNNNQLLAAAGHLRNIANSNMDKVELAKALKEAYSFILTSDELTWEDVHEKCYNIADAMLKEAKPKVEVNEFYKGILSDIKKTKVSFNESQKMEARHAFDKNWNRYFFGRITISDSGTPLESMWADWAEQYPDIFRADINDGDMVRELYDVLGSLQSASEIAMEYDETEQRRWLANEIYNQYWNVSTITTTADKYDKQIKLLKSKHRSYMAEVRESYKQKVEDQKLADAMHYGKKNAELYTKLRERKDNEIALAKEHGKARLEKYKEGAERKTVMQSMMATVSSLNKKLMTNSKDVHIPEDLKPVVIKLIESIDFSSKQLLGLDGTKKEFRGMPTKKDIALEEKFGKAKSMGDESVTLGQAVQSALELFENAEKIINNSADGSMDYSLVSLDIDLIDSIKNLIKDVGFLERNYGSEFSLEIMNTNDLKTLNSVVKSISNWVSKADQSFANKRKQNIANRSLKTIEQNDALGERKEYHEVIEGTKNFLSWSNLLPVNAFKRLGEAASEFFEDLQDSQDTLAFNEEEIVTFTKKLIEGREKKIREWRSEVKEFQLKLPNGKTKTVRMPISYVMSLYCVAKQDDAMRHLTGKDELGRQLSYENKEGKSVLGGGMTIKGFKEKLKVSKDNKNTIMTEQLISQITSVLTKEQRDVADALQKFMNEKGSEWGDAVSMALYGIKKFGINNYFPITVSPNTIRSLNTDDKRQSVHFFSILNYGFTKSRKPGANQSIEIGDIFEVFTNHMSMVAIYNAYALSVFDIARWYNFKGYNKDGEEISVKSSIENAFGKAATTYVGRLISDLNGQHESSRLGIIDNIFRNTKVAMVGNSLSVMLLQPTAYLKAMSKISGTNLLKSVLYVKDFGVRNGVRKAKKWCGIALHKSQGNFDTDISKNVASRAFGEKLTEKIKSGSLAVAGWMDEKTFGMLWNACEFEIRNKRKDLKVGSNEFYEAVAHKLREVIYETQVVDSPLTRSDLMRSKDTGAKIITMFASEITVAYNMVTEAFVDAKLDVKRNGKDGAWKRNAPKILRTLTAYTLTSALSQAVATAIQALRDDEDEDFEELLKMYLTNFLADLNLIGKIPYVKEYLNYAQGYSSSRPDSVWLESFAKSYNYFVKAFDGKEGASKKAFDELLKGLSYLSGIPGYNAYRDMMATLDGLGILDAKDVKEMFDDIFN